MKAKLLFMALAACICLFGCKNPELDSFSIIADVIPGDVEKEKCRIFLRSAKYGFIQVDEFECSSNCDYPLFGADLFQFRNAQEEYSEGFRLASSVDTTRYSEWGEWMLSDAYALSYQKRLYSAVPTYECSFNLYDLYLDEDSLYVLKREFGPDEPSFENRKQNAPKLLYSIAINDIESDLMKEQQEKGEEERHARDVAKREAEEERRKKEEMTINGHQIREGEKIVKIEWNDEIKTSFTRDDEDDFRFSFLSRQVPTGKTWILLYINEDYTYEDGTVKSSVPYLSIDSEVVDWYSRRDFSEKSTIHLAKARDQNLRFYSGSFVKGISNLTQNEKYGQSKLVSYKGYLWFLEVPE